MTTWLRLVAGFAFSSLLLGGASITWADVAAENFTVKVISIYDDTDGDGVRELGGCLVRVVPDPSTVLAGCRDKYVAPSCDGTHSSSPKAAAEILEQIQIAAITNRTIKLGLDNSKRHDRYCFVNYAQIVF